MSSRVFTLLLLAALQIHSVYATCPTNWTVLNRDCCSSTVGFNSTAPTFHLAQGVEYPTNFVVWNDSSHWSLGIDTDWTTLNIFWGQRTGYESGSFSPHGLIDVIRIFYQPGKGLYGLQFHDLSGQHYKKNNKLFIEIDRNCS